MFGICAQLLKNVILKLQSLIPYGVNARMGHGALVFTVTLGDLWPSAKYFPKVSKFQIRACGDNTN